MVELSEESIVSLRVESGEVERALTELRHNPAVTEAHAVTGLYDVAVAGAFRNTEDMRRFQAEVEAKDFCEACAAHPGFENWRREAVNAEKATKALQKIPSVQRVIGTAGEYNLIARVGARDAAAFHDAVVRDVQKIEA